jgi:hypothetical protein
MRAPDHVVELGEEDIREAVRRDHRASGLDRGHIEGRQQGRALR